MQEQWKEVPEFENYEVSNYGEIRNKKTGRFLKGHKKISDGSISVTLIQDDNKKSIFVHRLVLLVFVGESDLEVNHKNENKSDNRLSNLEYVPRSFNMSRAARRGRMGQLGGGRNKKLSTQQIKDIREKHKQGKSIRQLSKEYKVSQWMINLVI